MPASPSSAGSCSAAAGGSGTPGRGEGSEGDGSGGALLTGLSGSGGGAAAASSVDGCTCGSEPPVCGPEPSRAPGASSAGTAREGALREEAAPAALLGLALRPRADGRPGAATAAASCVEPGDRWQLCAGAGAGSSALRSRLRPLGRLSRRATSSRAARARGGSASLPPEAAARLAQPALLSCRRGSLPEGRASCGGAAWPLRGEELLRRLPAPPLPGASP
mmetsp:Transcript_302/g.940  ORF Transcript_302/g.940 Transcript_302/m.940 type:complete len:221 (+) Transcript_302:332-994(+)